MANKPLYTLVDDPAPPGWRPQWNDRVVRPINHTQTILIGECRERMRLLAAGSVHCLVTSPPYWGLRDYGVPGSDWQTGWIDDSWFEE